MGKAFVVGIGMTKFGKFPETRVDELGRNAVLDAIKDANLNPRSIQAAYCGHVMQGMQVAQRILAPLGLTGMAITNIENACASGSTAFREAYYAVSLGRYDVVLAIGVEKLTGKFQGALAPDEEDIEGSLGLTMPAMYALRARKYMEKYGLKAEHLAKISVINHKNAYYNEKASFGELITIETVLNSPMIADPLHLYDCNPTSDGAAAAVIVSENLIHRLGSTRAVEIASSALTSGTFEPGFIDMTFEEITHRAAEEAYDAAGCGPEDIDFAEVHDCFTIAEILRVEGLGLCSPGGMISWIEDGVIEISGKKPINPSGGLIGKGHPLGATGIAQIHEIVTQIRGEAGARQVSEAKVGLAMCRGGTVAGTEGGACAVHILRAV